MIGVEFDCFRGNPWWVLVGFWFCEMGRREFWNWM